MTSVLPKVPLGEGVRVYFEAAHPQLGVLCSLPEFLLGDHPIPFRHMFLAMAHEMISAASAQVIGVVLDLSSQESSPL